MAILTYDDYVGSAKQGLSFAKTAARTSIASSWFSTFDLAGNPGAGVLAGTSTTAGVVPTSATAGCPVINAFGGSATGYLTQVEFGSTVACRMKMFDMLFKAGAYAFNAAQTLTAQPSYSTRVPGGTDFNDTQIWLECVTAFTGNLSIAVTYTNQSGVTGKTTGTIALGIAPTVGRMIQLPLAAGDSGLRTIESVTATVSTVGTFNILICRPLWSGRCRLVNDGDTHDFARTGSPVLYATSALIFPINADSTSTGIPEIEFIIANK
jgi:hypothetical protein